MRYKLMNYILTTITAISINSCINAEAPKEKLLSKMQETVSLGNILYGHHDTYLYGHSGWKMCTADTITDSDVYQVCGKFPAVFSSDLGMIESENDINLDNNPFTLIRSAAIRHYNKGGIVTFSWHPSNPVTKGNSWDVKTCSKVQNIVKECLPGGSCHTEIMKWLDNVADFFESLKDKDGEMISFIFRPWHENTGNWFWWGLPYCSTEEYKKLWEMTYNYMVYDRGLTEIVWAYSPGNNCTEKDFMSRYPGDEMVDIIGFDSYEYTDNNISDYNTRIKSANEEYIKSVRFQMEYVSRIAFEHGKILALTECGFESVPYPQWWTEVLYEAIKGFPVAYVLSWRNACDNPSHFYGPWKGSVSEDDFKKFSQFKNILFLEDL